MKSSHWCPSVEVLNWIACNHSQFRSNDHDAEIWKTNTQEISTIIGQYRHDPDVSLSEEWAGDRLGVGTGVHLAAFINQL